MQIVAITDFHLGHGNKAEVLQRGDIFTPPGTGVMNIADHARSLIAIGVCCSLDQWPKIKVKTDASYEWAKAHVAELRRRAEERAIARR